MSAVTLQRLMAEAAPGERGLLAYEILSRQGRERGPLTDACETCGKPWDGYTLDWLSLAWQCKPCAIAALGAAS